MLEVVEGRKLREMSVEDKKNKSKLACLSRASLEIHHVKGSSYDDGKWTLTSQDRDRSSANCRPGFIDV
jgi:hypothetical protein